MGGQDEATKLLQAPNQNQNQNQRPLPGGVAVKKSPIPDVLLGLGMLALWVILIMVDLETSESLFTHAQVTSFAPEWSLILQIPHILVGQPMPVVEAKAAVVGWVLVICTLTCFVGYDRAREAVRHANHRLERAFASGLIILALIDFVANVMYVPGGDSLLAQVLWALIVTFGSFFFGIVGFRHLEHGIKTWRAGM